MEPLADDVWHIPLAPRNGVNAYLLGDVVVDAGTPFMAGKLLKALRGRTVSAHALTHAHPDHAGGSAKVVDALGLDGVAVGAKDATWVRTGGTDPAPHAPAHAVVRALGKFPKAVVARELREGDEVGPGFVVLDAPGHSPGHVAFWREADRVLVLGDVFFHLHPFTTKVKLREPLKAVTSDPAENRRSARKLAALEPRVVAFGHGPVLRDPARLAAFVATLPA